MMKKSVLLSVMFVLLTQASLLANKTRVEVKAPAEIKKGTEVTIVINVFHQGNSKMHYTNWVVLKINDQEVKRWQFDKNNLPPGENFTLEFKYVADETLTIEAQGNCNLHGNTGPFKTNIKVL